MAWQELGVALASGVLVPVIIGLARLAWTRRRVPTALARSVRRNSYLGLVLAESQRSDLSRLEVLAPRLTRAGSSMLIEQIQRSWAEIAKRGCVRVVTLDSEECIRAGAELLAAGIAVRVARRQLGSEDLSYHLFEEDSGASTCIVNHHQDGSDCPALISGTVPSQVYRDDFANLWRLASPLEAVLAEKIIDRAADAADPRSVLRALKEVSARLNLDSRCVDRLLPHLAFRNGCPIVIVVGLPGSGKSEVRRRLAGKLAALSIKCRSITDYVYAYRDFVHEMIKLEPARVAGFEAHAGGAFTAPDEAALTPALRALAQAARDSLNDNEVTLVEFARADLVTALGEFEHLRNRSHVIHVRAPRALREDRLSRRAEPPESVLDDTSLTLRLSDNHLLPSTAERTLYSSDGIPQLLDSRQWRRRVFHIENNLDDGGAQIDASLDQFIDTVLSRLRPGETPTVAHLVTR